MLPWMRKRVYSTSTIKDFNSAKDMLENHGILYDSKILLETEGTKMYCLYVPKKHYITASLLLNPKSNLVDLKSFSPNLIRLKHSYRQN